MSPIGPLIIRVVLGVTLAYFGYRKMIDRGESSGSNSRTYGAVEMVVAVFLVIGLYTEIAALLNVVILSIKLVLKAKEDKLFSDGVNYYILLLAMATSLIFTGGGMWALDMML